jgi:hypothetical protein
MPEGDDGAAWSGEKKKTTGRQGEEERYAATRVKMRLHFLIYIFFLS